MLATLIDAPFDDDDWLFEIKWDGFRALAAIHADGRVELVSRNGKDFAEQFPALADLAKSFRDAPYVERRTRDWVKIKAQKTQECVIAGWTEPTGARNDFGSLVLGVYEGGKLRYAGNVGTGFTREGLAAIMKKLKPLAIDHAP